MSFIVASLPLGLEAECDKKARIENQDQLLLTRKN